MVFNGSEWGLVVARIKGELQKIDRQLTTKERGSKKHHRALGEGRGIRYIPDKQEREA